MSCISPALPAAVLALVLASELLAIEAFDFESRWRPTGSSRRFVFGALRMRALAKREIGSIPTRLGGGGSLG
jgi:hypothetical protein